MLPPTIQPDPAPAIRRIAAALSPMPPVSRAFDELRFGPARTLNLRSSLPSGEEAARRAEAWLRERQMAKAGEVLIITGRGAGSEDGVPVVRGAVLALLTRLKRLGVVAEWAEHNAGSFAVRPAPVRALFEAPRRSRANVQPRDPDPATLRGLDPDTRVALRQLARRSLEVLGVRNADDRFVTDEMVRQFTLLSQAIPAGANREKRLIEAINTVHAEYDEADVH